MKSTDAAVGSPTPGSVDVNAPAGNEAKSDENSPRNFSEVFEDELTAIGTRRGAPIIGETPKCSEEERVQLLRKKALQSELTGIAFSGGGIRSATFCLGFLQGLAHFGLLECFDYLSTVSGGGYIGSWFAAWVKREGSLANVEKQLKPNRIDQGQATRVQIPPGRDADDSHGKLAQMPLGRVFDAEAEPIHHLRSYSNYLAPRPGLLSADGWTLTSIYLRNLLLNQVVLLFALLAVLLVVFWVVHLCDSLVYVPSIPRMLSYGLPRSAEAGEEVYIDDGLPLLSWWFLVPTVAGAISFLTACVCLSLRLYRIQLSSSVLSGSDIDVHVRGRFLRLVVLTLMMSLAGAGALYYHASTGMDGSIASQVDIATWSLGPAVLTWMAVVILSRSAGGRYNDSGRTGLRRLYKSILAPLVVAAFTACLTTFYLFGPLEVEYRSNWCLRVALAFGIVYALFHVWSFGDAKEVFAHRVGRFFIGFLSGGLGGFLLYSVLIALHTAFDFDDPRNKLLYIPYVITFGPPALLGVIVLTGFLQVGLLGLDLSEAQREWRSSVGGRLLICASLWLFVFGTVVFGPYLLLWSLEGDFWSRAWKLALGWGGTVLTGVIAARSPSTGDNRAVTWTSWGKELIARIAPLIFLIGMLTLAALGAVWLLHGMFLSVRPNGSPELGPDTYLALLNSANGPWYVRHAWNVPVEYAWLATSGLYFGAILILGTASGLLGWRVGVNLFSLNGMYTNRLVRCYLGASRLKPSEEAATARGAPTNSRGPVRRPEPVSGFDANDDMPLWHLRGEDGCSAQATPFPGDQECNYAGPLLIINTALNLTRGADLAWQERKAEPFTLTPYYCGCPTTGYRPTKEYAGGISLGSAVSTSGAAVSPNMGYHSAPAVTALLTVFNARLGAWFGNPRESGWRRPGPPFGLLYLLNEMFGRTDVHSEYVYLSDGGHFDNTGVYELIRRRCRFIVVCDAGADSSFTLDDLGGLIRKVLIDFGIRIDIDLEGMRPGGERHANRHVAVGKIRYGDVDLAVKAAAKTESVAEFSPGEREEGLLVYVKPCLTGDESPDLINYAALHPDFPHETTLNQFFTESQFESYRALGFHSAKDALADAVESLNTAPNHGNRGQLFAALYDRWVPPPPDFTRTYLESNAGYIAVQDALRTDPQLRRLRAQLYAKEEGNAEYLIQWQQTQEELNAERHMVARMLTVLENTWFGLRLDRYRDHPVNNGWMTTFRLWVRTNVVKDCWPGLRDEFSKVFQRIVDMEQKDS